MSTFEIVTKGKENIVEFTNRMMKDGMNALIPIIDGEEHPELMMGYVSETDKIAGMKILTEAINATDSISEAMHYIYNAMMNAAKDIRPDEQIEIDGRPFMISYSNKKMYTLDRVCTANLEDVQTDETEAIKALLVARTKIWMLENEEPINWEDEDTDYDYL